MDSAMKRIVVPWYSFDEWMTVYKNIYSKDRTLKEEAYKRMCIWKARCPATLPVGVERTMEILQVQLCDDMDQSSKQIENHHLQLMYSTVMMRFLNHVHYLYVHKEQTIPERSTMYRMAKEYKIPDWIVNLRHDAAHGSNLPGINIMRASADFAVEWLDTNYWSKEATNCQGLNASARSLSQNIEQKLQTLLVLLQVCRFYKLLDVHRVGHIPNASLRHHLIEIFENEDISEESCDEKLDVDDLIFPDADFKRSKNFKDSIPITGVIEILMTLLKEMLPKQRSNTGLLENLFAKCLLECKLFLPEEKYSSIYIGANGNVLLGHVSSFWHDILIAYYEANLMTDLLSHLVMVVVKSSTPFQQNIAACWLSHLCNSLRTRSDKLSVDKTKFHGRNTKEHRFAQLLLRAQTSLNHEDNGNIVSVLHNIHFSKEHHLRNDILENLVNEVALNPNKYTTMFLSSLLELLNPPLDASAKEDLLQLVELYTGMKNYKLKTNKVYTVESLSVESGCREGAMDVEDTAEDQDPLHLLQAKDVTHTDGSLWTKNYGIIGWSTCPFGRLPDTVE